MLSSLRAQPARTHLGLMLTLTFTTGIIDAVGYLGLDRVFTGNMTGNVVILGMGVAGADDLPVLGPTVALIGFVAGAAAAGRLLRGNHEAWSVRHTVLFAAVAVIVALAAVPALAAAGPDEEGLALSSWPMLARFAATAALGLAMGCQAAAARHIAVTDVTTVVVTSTITGLASDSVLGRGVGQPWARRAGAIVLIGVGATAGALLMRVHLGAGIAAAALIIAVVAILGHLSRPRDSR